MPFDDMSIPENSTPFDEQLEQFHIHANCFTTEIPRSVRDFRAKQLVRVTPCKFREQATWRPLWIATQKASSVDLAEKFYRNMIGVFRDDETMHGYIEWEEICQIVRFSRKDHTGNAILSIGELEFKQAPRRADIHVFRYIEIPYDKLDAQFEAAGFYEVTTREERIWTLLLGDLNLAKQIFSTIQRQLRNTGGVSKIELETVRSLVTIPHDFPLAPVVVR